MKGQPGFHTVSHCEDDTILAHGTVNRSKGNVTRLVAVDPQLEPVTLAGERHALDGGPPRAVHCVKSQSSRRR